MARKLSKKASGTGTSSSGADAVARKPSKRAVVTETKRASVTEMKRASVTETSSAGADAVATKPSKKASGTGTSSAGADAMAEQGKKKEWTSKDRFGAKRLRTLADKLIPKKTAVIEHKSAFRALLNVAKFRIPNELIDFIADHITPDLREYKYKSRQRMVYTRDMVTKVFGILCGNKPVVLLGKSDYCELRDVYRAGNPRPLISTAIDLLENCSDTDEDTIVRTWDLLCLALVVAPKSTDHIPIQYLACMADPSKTHEYAWDEHLLEQAMVTAAKIRNKRKEPLVPHGANTSFQFWVTGPYAFLGITYMDNLLFPPSTHNHVFDLSLPRVCAVKSSDFAFVVKNDADRKMLNNSTFFGWRDFLPVNRTPYAVIELPAVEEPEVNPSASLNEWLHFPSSQEMEIPPRFKHLYEKHRAIFASNVDGTLNNLAAGLKRMQSQCMSALLADIDAAIIEGEGPSVDFQTDAPQDDDPILGDDDGVIAEDHNAAKEQEDNISKAAEDENDKGAAEEDTEEVAAAKEREDNNSKEAEMETSRSGEKDVPQTAVLVDSSTREADVDGQQPVDSPPRSPWVGWQPAPVSKEQREAVDRAVDAPTFELFSQEDGQKTEEIAVPIPSDKPIAAMTESVDMTPADPKEAGDPKKDASSGFVTHEKKIKVTEHVSALYKKFVTNGRKLKQQPKGKKKKAPAPFVSIGRYFTCYEAFQTSLRPRKYLDSEIMNVWIEKFNLDSKTLATNSPHEKKKYAFTQPIVEKLIVDVNKFDADSCMSEFMQQNKQFKILKCDLLYFPIVKNSHWVVPCTNMMCKEFHIFDSMKDSKQSGLLDQCARNLFSNFATLVEKSKVAPALNFAVFPLKTIDHPQQITQFDCGFFGILYMMGFSGKVMAEFDNSACPDLRMSIAAELIGGRTNLESVEELMEKELQK